MTYAPDGSGTASLTPATVTGSTPTTLTFSYTAASGGMSAGKVAVTVPAGWTAPSTTSGTAGYTTASTGTATVSGETVTVSGVTLAAGQTLTLTYGAGGGSDAAMSSATIGNATFTVNEQSTSTGTMTALAASPSLNVTAAPDGSGTLTASPAGVTAGTGTTVSLVYTAATGGLQNGQIQVSVPSGWTAPSTTSGTAGYTTASTGTLTVSGQTITVNGLTLPAGATLTIIYGSGGGTAAVTGPATAPGAQFTASEKSTAAGTLKSLPGGPALQATVSIAPGQVSSFAGGASSPADGVGAAAGFAGPRGMVVVGGNGFVDDSDNNVYGAIREVNLSSGQVSTLAGGGSPSYGCSDSASPGQVSFQASGLTTDGVGLYSLCQNYGWRLRRTDIATGATSTVASLPTLSYSGQLAYGPDGNIYLTVAGNGGEVVQVNPTTGQSSVYVPGSAFSVPANELIGGVYGVAADGSSLWVEVNFYYPSGGGSSSWNLFQIPIGGSNPTPVLVGSSPVSLGNTLVSAGNYLYGDTTLSNSGGVALDRVSKSNGAVSLVAGSGSPGYQNGTGLDGWFSSVAAVASDGTNLWVGDGGNRMLRKVVAGSYAGGLPSSATTTVSIAPGQVSSFAGGASSPADGVGAAAGFAGPRGMVVVGGNGFVDDSDNNVYGAIREVNLSSGQVSTLAGGGSPSYGCSDSASPGQVSFQASGLTTDGVGLYSLCQNYGWRLRRTDIATGATSTVASLPTLSYSGQLAYRSRREHLFDGGRQWRRGSAGQSHYRAVVGVCAWLGVLGSGQRADRGRVWGGGGRLELVGRGQLLLPQWRRFVVVELVPDPHRGVQPDPGAGRVVPGVAGQHVGLGRQLLYGTPRCLIAAGWRWIGSRSRTGRCRWWQGRAALAIRTGLAWTAGSPRWRRWPRMGPTCGWAMAGTGCCARWWRAAMPVGCPRRLPPRWYCSWSGVFVCWGCFLAGRWCGGGGGVRRSSGDGGGGRERVCG